MANRRTAGFTTLIVFICALQSGESQAKPARCYTTDDGNYPCEFVFVEGEGSFEISAGGRPTYRLIVDGPGVAYGFVDLGNRFISLPGPYYREEDEPACWFNPATETRICAW